MKEIITENDRVIRVYDDVFDHSYRQDIYVFATKSLYQIGWADGSIIEQQQHKFLHSAYSLQDVNNLGIIDKLNKTEVVKELEGYALKHAIVNLSTPADANFVHTHPEDKVILYYVNMEWRDGWHGETLFFSENTKDIIYASPYTPGRIIVFDAKIPHTIRPQSHLSAFYRFTLALVYNKC